MSLWDIALWKLSFKLLNYQTVKQNFHAWNSSLLSCAQHRESVENWSKNIGTNTKSTWEEPQVTDLKLPAKPNYGILLTLKFWSENPFILFHLWMVRKDRQTSHYGGDRSSKCSTILDFRQEKRGSFSIVWLWRTLLWQSPCTMDCTDVKCSNSDRLTIG